MNDDLSEEVWVEASAAGVARPPPTGTAVADALREMALLLIARRELVLHANRLDVAAVEGALDEGALDRLRLDGRRIADWQLN